MPVLKIRNLGEKGVISDPPAFDLPVNYITDTLNTRYRNDKIVQTYGWDSIELDFSQFGQDYKIIAAKNLATFNQYGLIFVLTNADLTNGVYQIPDGQFNIIPTDGNLKFGLWQGQRIVLDVTGNVDVNSFKEINFTSIYGINIVNTSTYTPLKLDFSNGRMIEIKHWGEWDVNEPNPIPSYCEVFTNYKGFYIALNMTENGINLGNKIRWSDVINPTPFSDVDSNFEDPLWHDNDPRLLSGFSFLPDESDQIKAAERMNNKLYIYCLRSVHVMNYIGGEFVFSFDQIFSDDGAISKYCVQEVENYHFVVGLNDIYIHNGNTKKSIGQDRVKNKIYTETRDLTKIRLFKNQKNKEIFLYYNKDDEPFSEIIAVYNYDKDKWTYIEAPEISDITRGPRFNGVVRTWNDLKIEYINFNKPKWEDITDVWSEWNKTTVYDDFYYISPATNKVYRADYTHKHDGAYYKSFVERIGIDLDQEIGSTYPIKIIKQALLQLRGSGPAKIKFGGSYGPVQIIKWGDYKDFTLNDRFYKVDLRTTGRYLSYRLEVDSSGFFEIDGMDVSFTERGIR
jgi:hypothetical protein